MLVNYHQQYPSLFVLCWCLKDIYYIEVYYSLVLYSYLNYGQALLKQLSLQQQQQQQQLLLFICFSFLPLQWPGCLRSHTLVCFAVEAFRIEERQYNNKYCCKNRKSRRPQTIQILNVVNILFQVNETH